MLSFLQTNWGTILVAAILLILVVLIVKKLLKDKRNGKSCSCGGDCSHCSTGCMHAHNSEKQNK